ncbi:hypothetical protein B0O99DRAFT_609071 [Bisporella sp. PMI_857]|nr:hypothetical protein B0O99DRAFT_609071 [Bisporella sp. PMI_857]
MKSVTLKIQEAAPRNRELLAILSETDHAVPALEQQNRYIADLTQELNAARTKIAELDRRRLKEQKQHEQYRDSVMRRFAFKVSRKTEVFKERAKQEEKEYFDVLQQEHRAKQQENKLLNLKEEADRVKAGLEPQQARHVQAQRELDRLYDSIFDGSTPEFPGEDEMENAAKRALQEYHDARVASDGAAQAVRLLMDALRSLVGALGDMEDALSCSRADMFGGGAMWDMMERNALHRAEMKAASAQMLLLQAQRFDPQIGRFPEVQIAHGNLVSDVFLDNIVTDRAVHNKIKESRGELERARGVLEGYLEGAKKTERILRQRMADRSKLLENARTELQRQRQSIFENAEIKK